MFMCNGVEHVIDSYFIDNFNQFIDEYFEEVAIHYNETYDEVDDFLNKNRLPSRIAYKLLKQL